MTRTIRRHRKVYGDVIAAAEYIERDSVDAALRFFDAIEATLQGLLEFPGKGARREFSNPKLARLHAWAVDGFPNHLIFYEPTAYGIYVRAVLHGARELEGALADRG